MSLIKKLAGRVDEMGQLMRYGLPNFIAPKVSLSPRAQDWLKTLRKDGIVTIKADETLEVADHLDRRYFSRFEANPGKKSLTGEDLGNPTLFARDITNKDTESWGIELSAQVSFKDSALHPVLFNEDINGVLYNYLKRQPYHRNQPIIQKLNYKGVKTSGGTFHVDNLHQMSLMLLISDTKEEDSHMDYALGSHKRPYLLQGISIQHQKAEKLSKNYPIYHCTGKKGTLFLFDTMAIHRRHLKTGGARKMFHMNVTTGHHMDRPYEDLSSWIHKSGSSGVSRSMFEKLIGQN